MPEANSHRPQQILEQVARHARQAQRDPARMLRVVALLAAPVHNPQRPNRPSEPLDLRAEWQRLEQAVCGAGAPILLVRLVPPTLDTLRRQLPPRMAEQGLFPHVLHFSGHAWKQGLLLEDEYGQTHPVTAAQALVEAGLARAVVGHPRPVRDEEAIAFARTLYADLTDGYPLAEAVERASRQVTVTSEGDRHLPVVLLGDGDLRFAGLTRGEPLVDDARPRGTCPRRGRGLLRPQGGAGAASPPPGPPALPGPHLRVPRASARAAWPWRPPTAIPGASPMAWPTPRPPAKPRTPPPPPCPPGRAGWKAGGRRRRRCPTPGWRPPSAPDRTLALRAVQGPLYRAMAGLAPNEAERALVMLGYALSDLGQREETLEATKEAVRTLAPFFLRFPAAFADWMEIMVRNCVEEREALGREPDGELLRPVAGAVHE